MNLVGSSIFYEYRIHCVYIVKNKIIIPIFQGMKIGGADKKRKPPSFTSHPPNHPLNRLLIPLQLIRDLRYGLSLLKFGADEAFYLILASLLVSCIAPFCDSFFPRLRGDGLPASAPVHVLHHTQIYSLRSPPIGS